MEPVERTFADCLFDHDEFLRKHCFKLTKNWHDAEDLVSATYHQALRKQSKFEMGTNLRAWLARMAFHLFINSYRRNKKRHAVALENPEETFISTGDDPVKALSRMEVSSVMLNALAALHPRYRTVLNLISEGFKYGEVAEMLNVPLGTVMSRLCRARKAMQEYLNEHHYRQAA